MAILRSLRFLLAADAAFCLAAGLVLALAAGTLAQLMTLPAELLRGAGLVLLPWGLFVAWCATRPTRALTLVVVTINLLWAADSVALLLLGWVAPSAIGAGFILAQAAAGAAIALLQARALPPPARLSHA